MVYIARHGIDAQLSYLRGDAVFRRVLGRLFAFTSFHGSNGLVNPTDVVLDVLVRQLLRNLYIVVKRLLFDRVLLYFIHDILVSLIRCPRLYLLVEPSAV